MIYSYSPQGESSQVGYLHVHCKYGIENFNQYVKVNVNVLKPRGELTDDIMVNLFKAYKVASHNYFLYINKYNERLV